MAQQGLQKTLSDHQDLIGAYVISSLAAIAIRYVASVEKPGTLQLVLALLAVAGFVSAYLLIAQSKVESGTKGGSVIGAAVVAGICFAVTS